VAVADVQFCIEDLRVIGAHGSFAHAHGRLLGVVLLLGDHSALVHIRVALEVAPRVLELCRVLEAIRFSLRQGSLRRARIDKR